MATAVDNLAQIRESIAAERASWDERGEAVLESGRIYFEDEPVLVRVRKRGRRFELDDHGAATRIAGRPDGWLEVAGRLVAEDGFNVNRRGVVFVPVVEGRDLAVLVDRLAESSAGVCSSLLELDFSGSRQGRGR